MLFVNIFFLLSFISTILFADIQLIKKENNDSNTTLLVIGGIHGDEPGGYFAASILASHYKINSKNLWIVPNLNQDSIQNDNRGINGDMNRKFAAIAPSDKDKPIVDEIKKIILQDKVSLVLNLHDGNGFYRKTNKGHIFNPNAWGQTCVIDQCILKEDQPFGNLDKIATDIKEKINKHLLEEHHIFDVKNTKTKFEDEAMQLSLTYFAVTHNKPAFAIESSKHLPSLAQKVFYHLQAIEEFMNIMGISYIRKFDLNSEAIDKIINNYGVLTINNNFSLNLSNIKKTLSFVPIKSENNTFTFSHPLGSIVKNGSDFVVYIGNKKITALKTKSFKVDMECVGNFEAEIDGKLLSLNKTSDIIVNDDVKIMRNGDYRVNLIGFTSKGLIDEAGISVKLADFDKKFAVDEDGLVYRVEFYRNDEFCSMSKIHFKQD